MSSNFDYLSNDATENAGVFDLAQLERMAAKQLSLEDTIESLEDQLAKVKEQHRDLSQVQIPQFLLGAGLSDVRLSDGRKVKVTTELSASIQDEPAFAEFVTKRGDDDILKTTLQLGKLPENIVQQVRKFFAEKLDLYPEVKQGVHPQTLKKYIKTITGLGLENPGEKLGERYVPMQDLPDSVSVFTYHKTTIK